MKSPTIVQIERAFDACKSIRFAVLNAERHGGDFNLNDLLAANRLACEALECGEKKTGKKGGAK